MYDQSANDLTSHDKWIEDINDIGNTNVQFPIIADADRKVAFLYDMIDQQDLDNIDEKGIAFTIRSVFIIDPANKVHLSLTYPKSVGRNFDEILRAVDALQLTDSGPFSTPADWRTGQKVIVAPTVSTADARERFGADAVEEVAGGLPRYGAAARARFESAFSPDAVREQWVRLLATLER